MRAAYAIAVVLLLVACDEPRWFKEAREEEIVRVFPRWWALTLAKNGDTNPTVYGISSSLGGCHDMRRRAIESHISKHVEQWKLPMVQVVGEFYSLSATEGVDGLRLTFHKPRERWMDYVCEARSEPK